MTDVPEPCPVTIPVAEPTDAANMLLALHVPPGTASLNEVVYPTQAVSVPRIAEGVLFTASAAVRTQPEAIV